MNFNDKTSPAQPQLDHKMGSPNKQVYKIILIFVHLFNFKKGINQNNSKTPDFHKPNRTYQQNTMLCWIFPFSHRVTDTSIS